MSSRLVLASAERTGLFTATCRQVDLAAKRGLDSR